MPHRGFSLFNPLAVNSYPPICMFSQALVYYIPKYNALCDQYAPEPVPPEERLPMSIVGGGIFVVSFFWFGWTSYPSISYWSPMLAGGAFGLSVTMIFVSSFPLILLWPRSCSSKERLTRPLLCSYLCSITLLTCILPPPQAHWLLPLSSAVPSERDFPYVHPDLRLIHVNHAAY
jgi:hypothetical protein